MLSKRMYQIITTSGSNDPTSHDNTHIFKRVIYFIHFISDCLLPTVSGTCKGFFPRFSYHQSTKSCTKFIYGGCKGNANNYLTVEECNKALCSYSTFHPQQ